MTYTFLVTGLFFIYIFFFLRLSQRAPLNKQGKVQLTSFLPEKEQIKTDGNIE